ncbi:SubName: Full=Related to cytochrome P450 CYP2 subfamily-Aspergillus oryzae {ECO:0000313/EMBL:CCA75382.1} [Serendipita indica DSM 11827]|nr:SubName: Full=Related to cytochrome P450 CYP2 subfamily-Aspergillus oryzae {ECO:0000313/EMBL:CCA75382.1} [Serendipita indica DSM 11827]
MVISNGKQNSPGLVGKIYRDPYKPLMQTIGALLTTIAYGDKVYQHHGKDLVSIDTEAMNLLTAVFTQLWLVDVIPLGLLKSAPYSARYIPAWFPGASFKVLGLRGKYLSTMIRYWAYGMVEDAVARGTADKSIASKYMNQAGCSNENLRDALAVMYAGGVDTVHSHFLDKFLVLYGSLPWMATKIQREMDDAVGHGNAPTIEEITGLKLFNAGWKESFRWNPPVPLGKRTQYVTIGTDFSRYILRDSRLWGLDAHEFNPTRFLPEHNPNVDQLPNVLSIPVGFGSRVCPEKLLAERIGPQFACAILSHYDVCADGEQLTAEKPFEDMALW